MNEQRARQLSQGKERRGPVVYWMSRDQRLQDNWALIFARQAARERKAPLLVVFCLVPQFLNAAGRAYAFMLQGLEELEASLTEKGIPFQLITGEPGKAMPRFVEAHRAGVLVTDFDPLRIKRQWKEAVARSITVPFYEVDAHNIIPCWLASPKQEFAARTLRIKMGRMLEDFLDDFPKGDRPPVQPLAPGKKIDWRTVGRSVQAGPETFPVPGFRAGEAAAHAALRRFLTEKLPHYHQHRNDPLQDGQSGLSPYLHFGQLSAQRVALAVRKAEAPPEAKEAFLEELVVRRELSDNFCFYNADYDSFEGFPAWAQISLTGRRNDVRAYRYELPRFEAAGTHDSLWNAAQMEMVRTGKMHGYMRMYWAKKILEWSENPEEALRIAIYLNDKYELDGRDPNGYAGCAWSIGGVHDRAWPTRPVFGKVRFMNERGCRSKFNVDAYIEKIRGIVP
jgi:deoxyribodipyrimidine photo-lyase